MKRIHKWLLGIGITLVVLIGASVAVFYIGTNMVLMTLMPEMDETDQSDGQAAAEKTPANDETSTEIPQRADDDKQVEDHSDRGSADVADSTPPADSESNQPAQEQSVDPDPSPPKRPEVPSNATEETNKPTDEPIEKDSGEQERGPFAYSAEITEEKQSAVKENITFGERFKLTTTLAKNLSTEEISYFMSLAQGGLTVEEKREAKKIMLEKLTEEEYNELIAIAAKYGLSQGKGYEEGRVQVGLD